MRRTTLLAPLALLFSVFGFACSSLLGDFTTGNGPETDSGAGDSTVPSEGGPQSDATTGGADAAAPDGDAGQAADTGHSPGADGGCPATEQACGGACVDVSTSAAHCGACGNACASGFSCKGGVCGNAVVAMAAGTAHTCAALARGDVYCWGTNADGELGQGDAGGGAVSATLIPRDTSQNTVSGQAGILAGDSHVCALASTGTLECWGNSTLGQTSVYEATVDGSTVDQPVPVPAVQTTTGFGGTPYPYAGVALGGSALHACAIVDGGVVCWGDNSEGQLGHSNSPDAGIDRECGDTPCRPSPLPATFVNATPKQVAVGADFTCALMPDATITCWGDNFQGTYGTGSRSGLFGGSASGTTAIDGGVAFVAAGYESACAVTTDGAVWCWGANSYSQLGHDSGTGTDVCCSIDCGFSSDPPKCTPTPSPVAGIAKAKQVAVGCEHACALLSDGTVSCWGANDKGQLGTGDNLASAMPRPVMGLSGAAGLALGCSHSCAFTASGQAFCWGLNADGELGSGSASAANTNAPVAVVGLPH